MEGKGTRELNNKCEDRMKDTALIHHNWFDNKNRSPFHSIANYVFSEFCLRGCLSFMHRGRRRVISNATVLSVTDWCILKNTLARTAMQISHMIKRQTIITVPYSIGTCQKQPPLLENFHSAAKLSRLILQCKAHERAPRWHEVWVNSSCEGSNSLGCQI